MIGIIIAGLLGIVVGGGVFFIIQKTALEATKKKIIEQAEADGELMKKEKHMQAKEKFHQLKQEHEKFISDKSKKISEAESRVKQKEHSMNNKLQELNKKDQRAAKLEEDLKRETSAAEKKQTELEALHRKQVKQLEGMAGLTQDEAKEQLKEALLNEVRTESMGLIKEIVDEAKINANRDAKKIVIETIQRVATEQAVENSVSVFNIESDELKGRIIGREGRNIRALEAATGVEIIVDDTPEAIILSCFDPVRREIARLALHQLVTDGRIHPARIEEVVTKTEKRLNEEIIETGKRTCIDLNIHGLHPELIRMVGRMKYRSSYGQNLLKHSREVANLCASMAAELGLNTKVAKRAGLLHDIGKVSDEESEMPHAVLGMKLAEKYNEKEDVCNAIGAHHDEIEMTTLISPIVQVCDAVSGARPGARREIMESYIQRIKDLENVALSYDGVNKAFALQAGRELRVMVESEKIKDKDAEVLAFQISQRIQDEMTYPGQVKITVIRETRATSVAR